jgi:hypothetical protein
VIVALSSPAATVGTPGVFGAVFASTVVEAEAKPAGELPDAVFATVVNVYATPAVRPVMVHDPDGPSTVHVLPSGDEVTTYDVGVGPLVGAVTVIVAFSSPGRTVDAPGAFGTVCTKVDMLFVAVSGPKSNAATLDIVFILLGVSPAAEYETVTTAPFVIPFVTFIFNIQPLSTATDVTGFATAFGDVPTITVNRAGSGALSDRSPTKSRFDSCRLTDFPSTGTYG